jgi:hypothetical protein
MASAQGVVNSDKRGAKVDEITLTPLDLIDRIAALVPPQRTHRHHYFGVPIARIYEVFPLLCPNSITLMCSPSYNIPRPRAAVVGGLRRADG